MCTFFQLQDKIKQNYDDFKGIYKREQEFWFPIDVCTNEDIFLGTKVCFIM